MEHYFLFCRHCPGFGISKTVVLLLSNLKQSTSCIVVVMLLLFWNFLEYQICIAVGVLQALSWYFLYIGFVLLFLVFCRQYDGNYFISRFVFLLVFCMQYDGKF